MPPCVCRIRLINSSSQEALNCIFLMFSVHQAFGEDFLVDKLKAFYKSDPIPEDVS